MRLTIGGNDSKSSKSAATLLDEVRRIMGMKHDSLHTERTYCDWIKQFEKFHSMSEKQALFEDSDAKSGDECAGVFVKCSF